jgi:hypothetical protein
LADHIASINKQVQKLAVDHPHQPLLHLSQPLQSPEGEWRPGESWEIQQGEGGEGEWGGDEDEGEACEVCGDKVSYENDQMLLCDGTCFLVRSNFLRLLMLFKRVSNRP